MAVTKVVQFTARPWTASDRRRLEEDELRLNADIGKLVRRWSLLHDRFAEIFSFVVADSTETSLRPSVGQSIWHCVKSDLLQRKILISALEAKIELAKRYNWPEDRSKKIKQYEEYIWLLNETTKKSDARNDLVHAPIIFFLGLGASEYEAIVSDTASDPRASKLKEKDLYQYCSYFLDFCHKALRYLHDVSHYMNPNPIFPDRPKWLPISSFPTRKQRPRRFRTRVKYRIIRTPTSSAGAIEPPEA